MAGFVTWLRRQKDREDSVGTLSRDVIRDDPQRDVWTLEGLREQMIASGARASRYAALAEAAVEWGASVGISIQKHTDSVHTILAPEQRVTAASGPYKAQNSPSPFVSPIGEEMAHDIGCTMDVASERNTPRSSERAKFAVDSTDKSDRAKPARLAG